MKYIVGPELVGIFQKSGFKEIKQKRGKQRFIKNGLTVFFDYENIYILTKGDLFDCDYVITEEQIRAVLHLSKSYNRRYPYSSIEEAIKVISLKYNA